MARLTGDAAAAKTLAVGGSSGVGNGTLVDVSLGGLMRDGMNNSARKAIAEATP